MLLWLPSSLQWAHCVHGASDVCNCNVGKLSVRLVPKLVPDVLQTASADQCAAQSLLAVYAATY